MTTFSKTAPECLACGYFDDCYNKRLVACAMAEITQPLAEPVAVNHDYRDVWVDANQTVTIDLEDVKKRLTKELSGACDTGGYDTFRLRRRKRV